MAQTIYANPFYSLTSLLRDLHDRFIAEARFMSAKPPSLYYGEIIGSIAGVISQCEALAKRIDALERTDPDAFAAFQRAIGPASTTEPVRSAGGVSTCT